MSTTVQDLGLKVKGIPDVQKLEDKLNQLNVAGQNWVRVTKFMDSSGKLLGVQLKYIDKALNEQEVKLEHTAQGWVNLGKNIKGTFNAFTGAAKLASETSEKIRTSFEATAIQAQKNKQDLNKALKALTKQNQKDEEAAEKFKERVFKNSLELQFREAEKSYNKQKRQAEAFAKYIQRVKNNSLNMEARERDKAIRKDESAADRLAKWRLRVQRNSLNLEMREKQKAYNADQRAQERVTKNQDKEFQKQRKQMIKHIEFINKTQDLAKLREKDAAFPGALNLIKISGLRPNQKQHLGQLFDHANDQAAAKSIQLQKELATQILRTGFSFKQAGDQGQSAGDRVTLSWQSVVRVLQASVLYRAIAALGSALSDAARDSIEFQIKLAEIQTLSQKNQLTTGEWRREIRELSDAFGSPIFETTKATYEALSNQVAEGVEVFRFMNQAQKLAITTVSSLGDAVDATTAIINAFTLSAESVNRVSAILFKTVDLGRVTLGEMANDLGRISSLSDALGVTLEEQSAAISTLTKQGLKYDATQTLLSNIMQKLIRPSERMLEIYKEWGVTSGETAIRAFTFAGVMNKLSVIAHDSGDEMAEIGEQFNRIRAITGKTALDLEIYAKDMYEIRNASNEASGALELVQENAGKKLQVELNKIKNIFTVDIGNQFVDFFTNINEGTNIWGRSLQAVTGTSGGLAVQVEELLAISKKLLATWIAYRAGSFAVNAAMAVYNNTIVQARNNQISLMRTLSATEKGMIAFKLTAQALAPALASLAIYGFFKLMTAAEDTRREIAQAADDMRSRMDKINSTEFDKFIANLEREQSNLNTTFGDSIGLIARFSAMVSIASDTVTGDLEKAFKDVGKTIDKVSSKVFKDFEDSLDKVEDKIRGISSEIEDITKSLIDIHYEDVLASLDAALDAAPDTESRLSILRDEIASVTKEATDKLATATTTEVADDARRLFDIRDDLVKKFIELRTKEAEDKIRVAEREAKDVDRVDAKTLEARKRYQLALIKFQERISEGKNVRLSDRLRLEELRKKAFADGADAPEVTAAELEKKLGEDLLALDAERHTFAVMRAEAEEKRLALLEAEKAAEEAKLAGAKASFDVLKNTFAEIDSFEGGTVAEFEKLLGTAKIAAGGAGLDPLKEFELFRAAEAKRVELIKKARAEELAASKGALNTSLKDIDENYKQILEKRKSLLAKQKEADQNFTKESKATLTALSEAFKKFEGTFDTDTDTDADIARRKIANAAPAKVNAALNALNAGDFEKFIQLTQQLQTDLAKIEEASKDDFFNKISKDDRGRFILGDPGALGESPETASVLVDRLRQQLETREAIRTELEATVGPLKEAEAVQNRAKIIADELNTAYGLSLNLRNEEKKTLTQMADEMQRILETTIRLHNISQSPIPPSATPGGGGFFAFGGFNMASGGFPGGRGGSDVRPVWSRRGEMFINPYASRTYAPLLRAMNNQQGPSTLSNSFGDINITVNGGDNSQQTIQQIARGLRREIRKGLRL